jgi:hypothetical protein
VGTKVVALQGSERKSQTDGADARWLWRQAVRQVADLPEDEQDAARVLELMGEILKSAPRRVAQA